MKLSFGASALCVCVFFAAIIQLRSLSFFSAQVNVGLHSDSE